MIDPFELGFSNIVFFYPTFRPDDAAGKNLGHLEAALDRAVPHGTLGERGFMVYVHVPYCRHICRFCGYHRTRETRAEVLTRYADRIVAELRQWSAAVDGPHQPVSVLYFGGGTPTLLPARDLLRVIRAVKQNMDISESTEVDLESDLTALGDATSLEMYREAGVTRISFGAQSFDDRVRQLAGIDVYGDARTIGECLVRLRRAGYTTNYDLMFGLPGQTLDSFISDIKRSVVEFGVDHLDLLEFFLQPESAFARDFGRWEALTADRDTRRQMYAQARQYLLDNGYTQSSLTDFWREEVAPSRFKDMLYRNADILGVGAGSHGILADCAYRNARLEEGYLEADPECLPLAFIRPLSSSLMRKRCLVLLPKLLAFKESDFPGGTTARERTVLDRFVERQYLSRDGERFRVTTAGLLNSGDMMLDILDLDT